MSNCHCFVWQKNLHLSLMLVLAADKIGTTKSGSNWKSPRHAYNFVCSPGAAITEAHVQSIPSKEEFHTMIQLVCTMAPSSSALHRQSALIQKIHRTGIAGHES